MSQKTIDQYFKASIPNVKKRKTLTTITKKKAVVSRNKQSRETENVTLNVTNDVQIDYERRENSSEIFCLTPKKEFFCNKTSNSTEECNSTQCTTPNKTTLQTTERYTCPSRRRYLPIKRSNIIKKSYTPYKLIMDEVDTLRLAVDNFNSAREGAIPPNKFNLEKIYAKKDFSFQYSHINLTTDVRYEMKDVVKPNDFNAMHLFTIIINTFANPINCGYFTMDELDFIFSMLTLSAKAQMLLARMIKRRKVWHRIENISYPEISNNLLATFQELEQHRFCTLDIKNVETDTLLKLLQVDQIRKLCKDLKINWKGKKDDMMNDLLNMCKNSKTLFPGVKTPGEAVRSKICNTLGPCVAFQSKTIDIINRIVTLLLPSQDPQENLSDVFFLLMKVQNKEIVFPDISLEPFPIFEDKDHLLSYMAAKNALSEVLNGAENKNWETVKKYGNIAFDILPDLLQTEEVKFQNSNIPLHVRYFAPGYVWCKVLSKSVDAFKKSQETMERAVEMLKLLIEQKCHMPHRKGQWYAQLALIEMHHKKDLSASAKITLQGLTCETITDIDKMDLLERARKLVGRKTGISNNIKTVIQEVVDSFKGLVPDRFAPAYNTIEATVMQGNISGSKSTWCIHSDAGDSSYGSVELLALYHYTKNGFSRGIHCEGALPVTLFCILFWEELYKVPVSGAFVSLYQSAPQDLYTGDFYMNRKSQIDMKLEQIRFLNTEDFADFLESKYSLYQGYQSILHPSLVKEQQHFKELIHCLGVNAVVKICEKLLTHFKLWRSGFPDLIVWNYSNKTCKIVEVKGPSDDLSTKQILWLQYLNEIGLDVEVCLVNEKGNTRRRKNIKQHT